MTRSVPDTEVSRMDMESLTLVALTLLAIAYAVLGRRL